jgi:hypothetical protein
VARQHIGEDFGGFVPTLAECLRGHPLHASPAPAPRPRARQLEHLARGLGGVPDDYGTVFDWFERPSLLLDDPRGAGLLRNAFGLFLYERVLGLLWTRPSDGRRFPTRYLAERLLRLSGPIPSLERFFAGMPVEPWMCAGALPLSERAWEAEA